MPLPLFEFATAGRVVFGPGSAERVPALAAEFGSKPFRVGGSRSGADCIVRGEPTVDLVREGAAKCRGMNCDVVIATGGGSVIDAAKAIAILAANGGDPLDYLEVVGRGQAFSKPALPVVAVPTTSGTGAEVTRNAVLGSPEHGVKASLRSVWMLPRVAVVDPLLTIGLPRDVTVSTGLDALTQLIEPYVSVRANPLTDALCLDGVVRIVRALPRVNRDGSDAEARSEMSYAALLGGMALANAGLGVVHGFAAPLGGRFEAPHGAVCAALLPHGMAANVRALRSRGGDPGRFTRLAQALTGDSGASAEDGVEFVGSLCRELGVHGLGTYGVRESDVDEIASLAEKASSMKANPLVLTRAELQSVLRAAL
jgi:alcohol dehydrogenase class IV